MIGLNFKGLVLAATDRMPVLPAVAQRTLALFAKGDDVSVAEISAVVEQDVVIAGHLVSIANSALYSRGSAVSSLHQAIARIGIHKTQNALLGLSISRPLGGIRLPKSWSSAQFNAHSLASAIIGDLLVQGRTITLHEHKFVIVGVMAPDFNGISMDVSPDVRVPLRVDPLLFDWGGHPAERAHWWLSLAGRLKPGVTGAD